MSQTIQTMLPELVGRSTGPRYRAIAQVIASAITSGRLPPRTRLPTHRELAGQLDLDVGTVSRAYAELRRKGLVDGEVGRGTFVAEPARDAPASISERPSGQSFIDLSHNFPFHAPSNPLIAIAIEGLQDCDIAGLMAYQLDLGHPRHREAGRAWLEQNGLSDSNGEVAVTAGAQHALFIALAALTRPGDRVMTEAFTYFGMKSIAPLLGLELVGIDIDDQGIVPQSLEEACATSGARVLYCSPTLHNPTTSLMSEDRRQAVTDIARRHDVNIIEDDVYSFLLDPPATPLCQLAPDVTFYLNSLSKSVCPGLRVGYLRFPTEFRSRVGMATRATTLMAPPLMAEIACRMIEDGSAARFAAGQKAEIERRQHVAGELLAGHALKRHPSSFHVWLLPDNGWSARDLCHDAARLGIGLAPGELFAASAAHTEAVRVCVSAARDIPQLERALSTVSSLLSQQHQPGLIPVV